MNLALRIAALAVVAAWLGLVAFQYFRPAAPIAVTEVAAPPTQP